MDIKLHYIEKGEGFPLIMLHGNGENLDYFRHQIAYFSRSYRVIAIDTRGHGKSPRGEAPFTLEQFAKDLKGFLDHMAIKRAVIMGFSDGGNIAVIFGLKYYQYVEALIINGANLHPGGIKKMIQMPICIGYGILCVIARVSRLAVERKEMLGLMVNQPNISRHSLRQIKVPALVIVGEKDVVTLRHTIGIYRYLPYSKLAVVKGDHFIAEKKPKEFNREVEKFLKSIEKAAKGPET